MTFDNLLLERDGWSVAWHRYPMGHGATAEDIATMGRPIEQALARSPHAVALINMAASGLAELGEAEQARSMESLYSALRSDRGGERRAGEERRKA